MTNPLILETAEVLGKVPCLRELDEAARIQLAEESAIRHFKKGEHLINELETGEDVIVILDGRCEVTIGGFTGRKPTVVTEIVPGDAVGEMASLTGELRSATVTALEPTRVLWIEDEVFDRLLQRHPEVARFFVDVLSERLRTTGDTLAMVLDPEKEVEQRQEALRKATPDDNNPSVGPLRNVILGIYRELVLSRKRDVAFITLFSLIASLGAVRGLIYLARLADMNLKALLSGSLVAAVILLAVSGYGALVFYKPRARRVIAILFGIALALLLEQPSVWLTFDIFYVDVFTPDTNLTFDVEVLYERSEGHSYLIIALALLLQAVYLRHFYFRVIMVIAARISRMFRRRSPKPATSQSS